MKTSFLPAAGRFGEKKVNCFQPGADLPEDCRNITPKKQAFAAGKVFSPARNSIKTSAMLQIVPISQIGAARVAMGLAMRQGARKENIEKQSLTDEQRPRIGKEPQPFGLEQPARLALLLLGHVGTKAMLPRRASPASQTGSGAGHSYL